MCTRVCPSMFLPASGLPCTGVEKLVRKGERESCSSRAVWAILVVVLLSILFNMVEVRMQDTFEADTTVKVINTDKETEA